MRIWLLLFCAIIFQTSCYGIQEVLLEPDSGFELNTVETVENNSELTLREKLLNIYAKEITDTDKSAYLLEDILNKKFETGIVDNVHFFGYYRGALDFNIDSKDEDLGYVFNSINAGVNGKLKDGKTYYEARLRFNHQHLSSFLQYMPSDIYIANSAIPHHTIMFGNYRTPTGVEGGMSMTLLPFILRSQIARNYGDVRKVGMRIKGDYSLVDYDLGVYSSDTFFKSFFPGTEFAGWLNVKPLGKTDGRYGKLKFGSGLTAGKKHTDYVVTGAYASYEYKNIFANFEYAAANGYNSSRAISTNHSEGFYTTLGYKITPKLQVLGRYDQYVPDKKVSNDIRREYSAGINYFIKGQALKLMLNYIFCQNDTSKDSHRILLGTQILL